MRQKFNRNTAITVSLILIIMLVFAVLGHPNFAISLAISLFVVYLIVDNEYQYEFNTVLVSIIVGVIVFNVMFLEPIYSLITSKYLSSVMLFTFASIFITILTGALLHGIIYKEDEEECYEYEDEAEDENEDDDVVDLTYCNPDEPNKLYTYCDEKAEALLLVYGKNKWFIVKGRDKISKTKYGRYLVTMEDGEKLLVPKCDSIKKFAEQ